MPRWTPREFEILLGNYLATDAQLVDALLQDAPPGRSLFAIRDTRKSICIYHHGESPQQHRLSQMACARLAQSRGLLTCRECGKAF